MLERLSPTARNVSLALLCALALWFCWTVRSVLNPLIFGYLLAYVVHPFVVRLEGRGWSRAAAVNLIFAAASATGVVMLLALVVQGRALVRDLAAEDGLRARFERQVEVLVTDHGDAIRRVLRLVSPVAEPASSATAPAAAADEGPLGDDDLRRADVPAAGPVDGPAEGRTDGDVGAHPAGPTDDELLLESRRAVAELQALFAEAWERLWTEERVAAAGEMGLRAAGRSWSLLGHFFGSVLAALSFVVLLPVYTYFLLFELGRIHAFVTRYVPVRERDRVARVGGQIGEVLSSFFRGRLLVCLLKGLFLALGLAVLGVDYAFLIGITSGFLALIPFVGPFVGAVVAFLLALLDHGLWGSTWRVALVFGAAEVLEGYVLIPKVLGDSLDLHPVVVLVAIFAGGAALGLFGFLIALPLAATLVILARELVLPALAKLADEDAEPT